MTIILTILTIIGITIAIICIGILASAILTVLAIKNWGRWDGNTYEADEIDLQAKKKMAREDEYKVREDEYEIRKNKYEKRIAEYLDK